MRLLGKILLLCLTLLTQTVSAQQHQWAKSLDAFTDSFSFPSYTGVIWKDYYSRHNVEFLPAFSKANAMDLDSSNNVYVAGFYRDSMQIDSVAVGMEGNVHLSKFDSRGNLQWVQTIHSKKNPVNISDVLVIHNNRILVYGHILYDEYGFTLKITPSDSLFDIGNSTDGNPGYHVSFIIEYDSLGNLLYYQKIFDVKSGEILPVYNTGNVVKDRDNNLVFSVLNHGRLSNTAYTRSGSHSYNNPDPRFSQVLLKYSTHFDSLLWMKDPYDNILTQRYGNYITRIRADTMGNLYLFPIVRENESVALNGIRYTVPARRNTSLVVTKGLLVILNPNGDLIYADFFSSLAGPNDYSSDRIEDIVAIDTNRFYIIGYMSDTLRVLNQNYIPQYIENPDSIIKCNRCINVLPCIMQRSTQKLDWVTTTQKKIQKYWYSWRYVHLNSSQRTLLRTDHRDGIYASFAYSHNHDISIGGLSDSMSNIYDYNPTVFVKFDTLGNALWLSQSGDVKGMQPTNLGEIVYCGFYKDSFTPDPFVLKSDYTSGFVAKLLDYSITRGPVSAGPYCAGDTILVPYTIMGEFDTANYFIAELSDEYGNFQRGFRELGRLKSNQDGVIIGTLPMFQVASSSKYRIRVRATHPAVQSFYWEDTLQLLIYSRDKADPGPQEFLCMGDSMTIETFGGTKWTWSPAWRMSDSTARNPTVWPDKDTIYQIIIADSSGCGEADTAYKKIIVRQKPQIIPRELNIDACINSNVQLFADFEKGDTSRYRWSWFLSQGRWNELATDSLNTAAEFNFEYLPSPQNIRRFALVLDDQCHPQKDTAHYIVRLTPAPQLPAILSVEGDTAQIIRFCPNNPVNIVATLPEIPHYQWVWLNEMGDTLKTGAEKRSDTLYVFPNSSTHEVRYHIVTINTCIGRHDTTSISLMPHKPLSASTYPQDTTLCNGKQLHIQAKGSGGDSLQYQFQWIVNDSLISSDSDILVRFLNHDPSPSTIQLVLSDNCMPQNDTAEVIIRVKPALQGFILNAPYDPAQGPISDSEIRGPIQVCFGSELSFFAQAFGGDSTNYSFEWLLNDSLIGTQKELVFVPIHPSPFTLHLIIQDGCTVPNDTTSITINILPPLKVSASLSAAQALPDTLCSGEEITLFAQATGGIDSAYSYQWFLKGAFVSDLDSFLLTGIHPSPSTLQLILSDGCSSPNDTFTHTFFIRPSLAIDLSASTLCANPTTTLTANPSGGKTDNYTIQWFDEAENMIGTGSSIEVTPSQLTTYHAILTDGCSQTQAEAQIQIDYLPDTLILSASPTEGCEPLEIEFEIYTNYRDSFSGILFISDTDSFIIDSMILSDLYGRIAIRPNEYGRIAIRPNGIYTPSFQFISKLGCTGVSQYDPTWPNAPTITVHPKPTAAFSFEPDSPRLDNPEVRFQNLSTGATSYQWELPPLGTFTDFEPTVRYSDTGRFSVMHIAISDQDCRDTAMGEVWIQDVIRFFMPTAFSPNGDGINDALSPSVLGLEVIEFNIFNRWGERIFSSKGQAWDGTYRGKPVQAGVYTYTLKVEISSGETKILGGNVTLIR